MKLREIFFPKLTSKRPAYLREEWMAKVYEFRVYRDGENVVLAYCPSDGGCGISRRWLLPTVSARALAKALQTSADGCDDNPLRGLRYAEENVDALP